MTESTLTPGYPQRKHFPHGACISKDKSAAYISKETCNLCKTPQQFAAQSTREVSLLAEVTPPRLRQLAGHVVEEPIVTGALRLESMSGQLPQAAMSSPVSFYVHLFPGEGQYSHSVCQAYSHSEQTENLCFRAGVGNHFFCQGPIGYF